MDEAPIAPAALREQIRCRMHLGTLPARQPPRVWGGPGNGGDACGGCGRQIAKTQLEIELDAEGRVYHAHVQCFLLWSRLLTEAE